MPTKFAFVLIAAALIAALAPVHAARAGASLFVDDAGTVAPGHCQLQSGLRASAPGREWSLVPACDIAGNELGLDLSDHAEPHASTVVAFGVKRVLHAAVSRRWAVAASIGANWQPKRGGFDGWNVNLPLSLSNAGQTRHWHFNLGWNAPRRVRGSVSAGIGLEHAVHAVHAEWSVLADVCADHRSGRLAQFGLRRQFGAGHRVDVLIGDRNDGDRSPWPTLDLNLPLPR